MLKGRDNKWNTTNNKVKLSKNYSDKLVKRWTRKKDHMGPVPNLDDVTMGHIQNDLVVYCRQRHTNMLRTGLTSNTPELDNLREVVFSIPLVSAFVESLFSKMDYNQSKHRSRLADDTMSAILHCHDSVVADPKLPLSGDVQLKTLTPSMCEKEKMTKHIGKVICKIFPEDGLRYHGRIVDVDYHDIYARWMFLGEYTDGDKEHYWRNELNNLLCTCKNVQDGDVLV